MSRGGPAAGRRIQRHLLAAAGSVLSRAQPGPVTAADRRDVTRLDLTRLDLLTLRGTVPAGTRSIPVTRVMRTRAQDDDGPTAWGCSAVGYAHACADDLALRLSAPLAAAPRRRPPPGHVPRFAHVSLIVMANEDLRSIIGDSVDAPYSNSLPPRASLLATLFAEVHPSDANSLALAGARRTGSSRPTRSRRTPRSPSAPATSPTRCGPPTGPGAAPRRVPTGPATTPIHGSCSNDDLPLATTPTFAAIPAAARPTSGRSAS